MDKSSVPLFFDNLFRDVFEHFNSEHVHKYYHPYVIMHSKFLHSYDYRGVVNYIDRLKTVYSKTILTSSETEFIDDRVTIWRQHEMIDLEGNLALIVDVMTNYEFKDDKIYRAISMSSESAADMFDLPESYHAWKKVRSILTRRETQLFELLIRGMRPKGIAESLHLSIRTVEGHTSSIIDKLGIHNLNSIIEYALSQGLISASTNFYQVE